MRSLCIGVNEMLRFPLVIFFQNYMDQNHILHVWTNNSKTTWVTWPTEILMHFFFFFFFSFSHNLLHDVYANFKNSVDNFLMTHKTCSILFWGAVPP